MDIIDTITLTKSLISVAVLLQTIEIVRLMPFWIRSGIWQWDTLKNDYSKRGGKVAGIFFKDSGFLSLTMLALFSSLIGVLTTNFLVLPILLFTTIMTSIRWRRTFNGGSDYMTIMVLLASSVGLLFQRWEVIAISYLAVQTLLSYFISGLAKLKERDWRSGKALQALVLHSNYVTPEYAKTKLQNSSLAKKLSWLTIVFECSFPLAMINPSLCSVYIAIAVGFHLANFYIFGLNRFVFSWLAAYPALYYFSGINLVSKF